MQKIAIAPHLVAKVEEEITRILPTMIAFRQERHRFPELTWQEHATAAAVAKYLREELHLEVQEGVGRLGVVAMIQGEQPGPTLALRADMDALPIQENSGKSYASCHPG